MKHTKISPCSSSFFHNEEAAPTGEAQATVNLRRRCQSLEVVGTPENIAHIPAGHRIICVLGGSYITTSAGDIFSDGTRFHHTDAEVIEAHSIEQFLVVNTSDGILYFTSHNGALQLLNFEDAIPELHLSAISTGNISEDIPQYNFITPLTDWRAPLPSDDVRSLASIIRSAYQHLQKSAADDGEFTRPILLRYAVKMTNDEYLWMSAPVMIGFDTVKNQYRIQGEAVASSGHYTSISATSLSLSTYQIGISVVSGIKQEWHHLIKSVDILATAEVDVANTSLLDYRMATTSVGTRRYIAEFGPAPRSNSAIVVELINNRWQVIASCSQIGALENHEFLAWGISRNPTSILPSIPTFTLAQPSGFAQFLTNTECSAIVQRCSHEHLPACTLAHSGRLYMGGGSERIISRWHPVGAFLPPFSASACTVKVIEQVGEATIVSNHTYPFTPSSINPLICAPHLSATSLRIEITSGAATKASEHELSPVYNCGIAAYIDTNLQPISPPSASPSTEITHNTITLAEGRLTMTAISQPLVQEHSKTTTGAQILALTAAERPIYSGGFGRYPLYMFTNQGIFVIPQSSKGEFGEAKLMSRKTIDTQPSPIAGDGKIWFISSHQQLCTIEGSKVKVIIPAKGIMAMAWNDAEQELWLLHTDSSLSITDAEGYFSHLSLKAQSAFFDGTRALLVLADGCVLNICKPSPAEQTINYLSHPILLSSSMQEHIDQIIWNIFGENLHLRLSLLGERGESCHGFTLCSAKVDGNVNAPISLPVFSQPARSIRIHVEGTAPSGAMIRATDLYTSNN